MSSRIAERPVSIRTFGPVETHLQAPTPQRSVSMRRSVSPDGDTRPTLIRSQTPNVIENQQEIAIMFSENMFADPAPKKVYGKFGPNLFTDGHQRLVFMLREECGRLFSYNKTLKNRISQLERQSRQQAETITDLRSSLHSKGDKLALVTNELRDAHEIIREIDCDLERTRSKRLSRIGQHIDLPLLGAIEYGP